MPKLVIDIPDDEWQAVVDGVCGIAGFDLGTSEINGPHAHLLAPPADPQHPDADLTTRTAAAREARVGDYIAQHLDELAGSWEDQQAARALRAQRAERADRRGVTAASPTR